MSSDESFAVSDISDCDSVDDLVLECETSEEEERQDSEPTRRVIQGSFPYRFEPESETESDDSDQEAGPPNPEADDGDDEDEEIVDRAAADHEVENWFVFQIYNHTVCQTKLK